LPWPCSNSRSESRLAGAVAHARFYLIKGHIESKKTEGQRDRFIQYA
jgi:hypothetical protein